MRVSTWNHYIALGDNGGSGPSWPERLAEIIDGHNGESAGAMRYRPHSRATGGFHAAARGELHSAADAGADLVSLTIRGDELIAGLARPVPLAESLEPGILSLRQRGATVLLANCFGPRFDDAPTSRRLRAAEFTGALWGVARRTGATVLDLWSVRDLHSPNLWGPDRANPTGEGHRLIAASAAHALGIPYAEVGLRTRAIARVVSSPR